MNLGAYTHQTTLQRHKMHVRELELKRENKALKKTVQKLRSMVQRLKDNAPSGFVFPNKAFEEIRRAM